MTIAETRTFEVKLLDDVCQLAQAICERVDALFERLETENGEEKVQGK